MNLVNMLKCVHIFYIRVYRRIVLVAIEDNGGSISDEAVASLEKLGAHSVLKEYRSSYGLIGWTGPGYFGASVQVKTFLQISVHCFKF